ncbi:MAG TPA: hypothetical protein VK835_09990 [Bacteroidia bacterium]|jgi:hypothetical protein|nr:hypothetical protein [Bacteroidia bacterium]
MKKLVYTLFLLFFVSLCNAASRYWVTGGTGNYASTTNWSTSSGGSSGASVPTSTDDALWDGNSGSGTVSISTSVASLTATFTGFTGTLNITNFFTINGNLTLGSGMSITGTSYISINAASTITTNGISIPFFRLAATAVYTLADNLNVVTFTLPISGTFTVNTHSINITGDFAGTSSVFITGTASWNMTGTGSFNFTSIFISTSFTQNSSGTITYIGTSVIQAGGTFTWTSGAHVFSSYNFAMTGGTISTGSGFVLPKSTQFDGSITLLTDVWFSGNVSMAVGANTTFSGTFNIYIGGSLDASTGGVSGSNTQIILNGTGTLQTFNGAGVQFSIDIIINTSGTITMGTQFRKNSSLFQVLSVGTFVNTGSTIYFQNPQTLDLSLVHLNNVTFLNTGTATLNSILLVDGTLTCAVATNTTLQGSFGATINTLSLTTAGLGLILQAGNTYNVTGAITFTGTSASHVFIKSSSTSVRAILTLSPTASQNMRYCNGTWIDSSLGKTIHTIGTLSNTINWSTVNNNFFTFN